MTVMRVAIRGSREPDQVVNTTSAGELEAASAEIERRFTLVREIAGAPMRLDAATMAFESGVGVKPQPRAGIGPRGQGTASRVRRANGEQ